MNEQIIKIGLESSMLNYVDNETPRHYFLSGNADEQDLAKFAELIVRECMSNLYLNGYDDAMIQIQKHFGVEQ